MNSEREQAYARYLKLKAIRDVHKRQLRTAERELTDAANELYHIIGVELEKMDNQYGS